MVEEKLPVNLGKTRRSRKPKAASRGQADIAPPTASHAPGQTFHPEATAPVVDNPTEAPEVLDLPKPSGKLPIAHQSSMGKKLAKDLLWLVIMLLVLVVVGLAAIYFLKI